MAIGFNLPGVPFRAQSDVPDYIGALSRGITAGFQPKKQSEELLSSMLQNKISGAKAKYAMQNEAANLANTEANTGLTTENTYKQQLLNKYLPQREPAEINEIKARSNYYNSGGSAGSTGSKDYMAYTNGVATDNPNLNPQQLREASDVLAKGGTSLSDGTQLRPLSFGTKIALDRAVRATTTAQQINAGLNANQAESEIDVLNKYADQGLKPYGTTFFDRSPQQILDTFKNDDSSQTQLGRAIGAQALQYEIAQQRIKLAGGQPGVTSTEHLIDLSKQTINAKYPRLSAKARGEAARFMDQALKAGLHARNKVGISPSYLTQKQYETKPTASNTNTANLKFNPNNYEVPEGYIGLYKNGELFFFPPNQVNKRLEEGFSYE